MEGLMVFAGIIGALGILGALAIEFGVDSREDSSDPRRRAPLSV